MSDTVKQVLAEREARYGIFVDLADVSQRLKEVVNEALDVRNKVLMPDQLEALEMVCHKIARIVNGNANYIDNWIDIAGYAQLVADRLRESNKGFG